MKKLGPTYNPKTTEPTVNRRWLASGYFNPDKLPNGKRRRPFSIAMPPVNVTGELHLGHSLFLTTQDILIRWKRMSGLGTLWIPGTDHAGIATQIMVERLLRESGLSRYAIGRDAFLKHVWAWKKKYGTRIVEQIKRLGASCDWSREHFTMDPDLTAAVQAAFLRLYEDGLIYRGARVIHWCPDDQTGISDLEVAYREEQGTLWYIKYPLVGGSGSITVATTRPETMLGDAAVAVHPKDARYASLVGKAVRLPLVNRELPILSDEAVDASFGTGAVKVTPAHDATDFEIGERHRLPHLSVIGLDGRMTIEAGEFSGLPVREARRAIVERLRFLDLIAKEEPYTHNVAYCSRSNTVIEPILSRQWFVKTKPLAARALRALKAGQVTLVPDRFTKVLVRWLENIRDWNISRQLWWGHRLPIWYCIACDEPVASVQEPTKPCRRCGDKAFRQDEDTLDTWFSSGLWTFSTLGWPKRASDLTRFHPTSVLGTAWDILFFWVARMLMFSLYFRREVPFKTVYLHGLVLNERGEKMSKSKGTGVDPLVMADKYGTDALRLALIVGTSPGLDFRISEQKIAGQRNFCNKLWNISRYVLTQPVKRQPSNVKRSSLADKWILARLHEVTAATTAHLAKYQFGLAVETLQQFIWTDLADWYVEIHKVEKNTAVLRHVLRQSLVLLHPFAPFITEAVWEALGEKKLLMVEPWPAKRRLTAASIARPVFAFHHFRHLVVGLRNLKAHGAGHQPTAVWVRGVDANISLALKLAAVSPRQPNHDDQPVIIAGKGIRASRDIVDRFESWRSAERARLEHYITKKQSLVDNSRAPEAVRREAAESMGDAQQRLADLR